MFEFLFTANTTPTEDELRAAIVKLSENLVNVSQMMGKIALSEEQDTLRPHNYNTAAYDSLAITAIASGSSYVELTVGPDDAAKIYLGVLNTGRPSGTMPNIDALAEWINRRGISFSDASDRQMAYVLAKRIQERGTLGSSEGYHWFDNASESAMPQMEEKSVEFIEVFG